MEFKSIVTLSLLLILGGLPLFAFCQPYISGPLSGTLGPGTFIVDGNCTVLSGESLVIAPGTTLLFSGHFGLEVYGQLIAEGTETDSIFFSRQYSISSCNHRGIRIQPGASLDNRFDYCHIDQVENLAFPDCFGGAVLSWGAGAAISHCLFTNDSALYGGGVYSIDSEINIMHSAFINCFAQARGGCIYSINSNTSITNCLLLDNRADLAAGVEFYNNDDGLIRDCVLGGNVSTSSAG